MQLDLALKALGRRGPKLEQKGPDLGWVIGVVFKGGVEVPVKTPIQSGGLTIGEREEQFRAAGGVFHISDPIAVLIDAVVPGLFCTGVDVGIGVIAVICCQRSVAVGVFSHDSGFCVFVIAVIRRQRSVAVGVFSNVAKRGIGVITIVLFGDAISVIVRHRGSVGVFA
jgi:hypothetical protein